ncbi:IS110 family transposase [Streptomyces formicae]|uniref:IS110 family transposase n=1 Tax=Streptomyces formicae TaxID=1616117 RepID=UPI001F312873|nr:IS110 family transposase [Streptomyces formicae]
MEGTGSYGAAMVRYLIAEGVRVIEVNRPDRATRRQRCKTDTVDAEAAARAVLTGRASIRPKHTAGAVEELRVAKMVKASATATRSRQSSSAPTPNCGKPLSHYAIPPCSLRARVSIHGTAPFSTPCSCWPSASSNSRRR